MLLNKRVVLLVKIANRVFDLVLWFCGLFGISLLPPDRHYKYKGVCLNQRLKGIVEQIPNFEVRDSDIFVATFPRSGTHLASEIIDGILDNGDTSRLLFIHQESRSPLIELGHPYSFVITYDFLTSPFGTVKKGSGNISGYYETWKSPRVFKTHLPVQFVPKKLLAGKGRLIYVTRNPMDTMVSNWKLLNSFPLETFYTAFDSFGDYVEAFLSGEVEYGSWFDHVAGFWKRRHNKNVFVLKYEDVTRDIRGTIRRLAEFLERGPLSDETVEKIANHCSLKSMKANKMTTPDVLIPGSVMSKHGECGFVRKGVVGDWKNQMTEEQAEKIRMKYQEKVASQGLNLEFE